MAEEVAEILNPLAIRILGKLKEVGIGTYAKDTELAKEVRHEYDGKFCTTLSGLQDLGLVEVKGYNIAETEKGSEILKWFEEKSKSIPPKVV